MSYQVLARKWRPRTFHELVGQEHVSRALINALDQGRLHHAYLFTGTRGVGKTTLARILAKCLNCETGVTSTPCGVCETCREIDEGRFVDLIEVDAASRTKVEDTRELLDNVQYAPTQGRYKVYLIDEVHMLSTHSFNALLKTLEEPPPHVKFLLATTDPQKLPVTVLSRCLQFTLKNMPPERVVEHLSRVLEAEEVAFEEAALWLLGKAADGSMRDALSLTDQAIAFGQGSVQRGDVAAMLGTLDQRHLLALAEALADVDAARVLAEIASLAEQGPDFGGVLDDLAGVFHRLAIAQMVPQALDNGHGDREALLMLASRFTAEDVQLYYQIALQGRADMVSAPDMRTALEMTLLRMLAFRPQGVPKPPQTPLPMRAEPTPETGPGASIPDAASAVASAEHRIAQSAGSLPEREPELPRTQAASSGPADSGPAERSSDEARWPVAEAGAAEEAAPLSYDEPALDNEPTTVAADAEEARPALAEPPDEPPPWAVESRVSPPQESAPAKTPSSDAGTPSAHAAPASRSDASSHSAGVPQMDAAPEEVPPPAMDEPASGIDEATAGAFDHTAWLELFPRLALGGLTRNLAAHCIVERDDGDSLMLRLDPSQAAMHAEVHVERVQAALKDAGVVRRHLAIEPGDLPGHVETPKARSDREAHERHLQAVEALRRDPHIQELEVQFGARLLEQSVTSQNSQPAS
ncbi:DNA polymerase III subunit gamma/tau [Halomonas shantousis]